MMSYTKDNIQKEGRVGLSMQQHSTEHILTFSLGVGFLAPKFLMLAAGITLMDTFSGMEFIPVLLFALLLTAAAVTGVSMEVCVGIVVSGDASVPWEAGRPTLTVKKILN